MISDFFKTIERMLSNPDQESLSLSLSNVHGDGVFSLVIDGKDPGELTRVFVATKKLRPFDVQFHTHRYPIILTSIKGCINHHRAHKRASDGDGSIEGDYLTAEYEYRSFLNGGSGLKYISDARVDIESHQLPPGSQVILGVDDFHTMSVSKGSMWVVQECGFMTDSSRVLGIPFTVEGLYTKPEMFQINDMCQLVLTEVRKIVSSFNSISANI